VHVSDLAAGHVSALGRLLENRTLPSMNLGAGRGFSVREVIAAVKRVTGRPLAVREGPPRPGDNAVLVADGGLARRVLGFKPRFRDLEDIVDTAWAWFKKRHPADGPPTPIGPCR
jgi:UDP-glucose 4-epimerase